MKKTVLAFLAVLTAFISTSAFAGGWRTERWIDENGIERITIVDTNEPDLTDEELRESEKIKAQFDPFYYDYEMTFDGPNYTEFKQRGTGKIIIIHKH